MVEHLVADVLKDFRGLGKPNDAEYQDFRFSVRTHTSFVSLVSQTLMDKCEAERNQITLTAAVNALEEASFTCCLLM